MNNELVSTERIEKSLAEFGVRKTGEPLLNKITTAVIDLQSRQGARFNYGKVALQLANDASRILNLGLNLDDHDLIYTITRGDVVTLATHYDATLRVAKRRGYIIIPTFYPVFEGETIEFEETDGEYKVKVNEKGDRFSREIKVDDLISKKLIGCAIKISVSKILNNGAIEKITERFDRLSNDEIMKAQKSSSAGLYLTEWKQNPQTGKKYVTEKLDKDGNRILNKASFWYQWTTKMVYKTCLRYSLSFIKESLPEFKEVYDFIDADYQVEDEPIEDAKANVLDAEVVEEEIDLNNPSDEMKTAVADLLEMFTNNTALADEQVKEIVEKAKAIDKNDKKSFNQFKKENGASILALAKLKKAQPIFDVLK